MIFDEIIPARRKDFDCLRQSGLKLSAHKFYFGTTKIDYLCSTTTPRGIPPESAKILNFLQQILMPSTVKQVQRLIGFVQFRNFIPYLGRKLSFFRLLRKKTPLQSLMITMNLKHFKNCFDTCFKFDATLSETRSSVFHPL